MSKLKGIDHTNNAFKQKIWKYYDVSIRLYMHIPNPYIDIPLTIKNLQRTLLKP